MHYSSTDPEGAQGARAPSVKSQLTLLVLILGQFFGQIPQIFAARFARQLPFSVVSCLLFWSNMETFWASLRSPELDAGWRSRGEKKFSVRAYVLSPQDLHRSIGLHTTWAHRPPHLLIRPCRYYACASASWVQKWVLAKLWEKYFVESRGTLISRYIAQLKSVILLLILDLNCCDKSSNEMCQETCKTNLESNGALQDIIDNLQEGGCGVPLPHVGDPYRYNVM